MKKIKVDIDRKYIKICSYAGLTVVVTVIVLLLLYRTGGFWANLWDLFTSVLKPIIIGGAIEYLLSPVVKKIEQGLIDRGIGKLSRVAAVAICIILVLGVISVIVGIIAITAYRTVHSIGVDSFTALISYLQNDFSSFAGKIEEYLGMLGLSGARISQIAGAVVSSVSSAASGLLFGIIFSIYFMLDGNTIGTYWHRVLRILIGNRPVEPFRVFLEDADRVFSGYIRGQFIDAAIIGVATTIIMLIIGVPNGSVVGVLTGCGNLIPYVGPVIGYLTLALVCIPAGAWLKLIFGAVALAVLLFVDGNIINPKLLSSNVMVHPLLVVTALIGGGAMGGIIGMLIAVPVAALIKIQFDRFLDRREKARQQEEKDAAGTDEILE